MNSSDLEVSPHADLNQAVLEALPYAIALLDGDGVIVLVNEIWRRFSVDNGVEPGKPAPRTGIGIDYLAVCSEAKGLSAEGASQAAAGIRAVLSGRQANFVMEYPCHAPDEFRWFLMRVNPLALPGAGAIVMHIDITARKKEEVRLHDSELRLQLALDATGDGLWDWNPLTGQVYLSPGYYAMTGYRPEDEPPSLDFFLRLLHPEDRDRVRAGDVACLRGEIPQVEVDFRMITRSGEIRWIRGRGRVVERDAAGAPVRMIGFITDITEYKRMEEALRDSERRFRAVVEDQTEVIARFRPDGTFLFVNEVYCRFFGKHHDELIGNRWQPVAHPDDLSMIESQLKMLSPACPVVAIENRVFAGDGKPHWMQFINRGFFDETGNLSEIQSVGRDITQRKQLEAKQQQLLDQLTRLGREMMRVQEHERSSLAHELHDELSQQLVAIRAHAGAIRRHASMDDNIRNDVASIEATVSRIYLSSHRIMEGLHPQLLDSANLTDVLKAYLDNWAENNPGIKARMRISGALHISLEEMRTHLFRIVQEGLANVLRHARAQRVRLYIGERMKHGQHLLRLVLSDDGIGMDMDTPRQGYGLMLMAERAQCLGGRLQLSSQPGRGLRILLEVPLPA